MMRSKAKFLESLASEFLQETLSDYDFEVVKTAEVPKAQESNLGPAVQDAFFGPPAHGLGPQEFVARISKPNSNFNKAAQSVSGKITVSVTVDAASKLAAFKVQVSPAAKLQDVEQIKKSLEADYVAMYNKTPVEQLNERLAAKTLRPADIRGTSVVVTL